MTYRRPEMYVATRWLSVYDVALSTYHLFDAFIVFILVSFHLMTRNYTKHVWRLSTIVMMFLMLLRNKLISFTIRCQKETN